MNLSTKALVAAALIAAPMIVPTQAASAGVGDLLVAPTRLVLNGGRGAEIILNDIGDEPATYRISVEFRRMRPDGTLEEVAQPSAAEQAARDMVIYAPRRVTLAPNEPQSIRISARPAKGVSFKLTPVYGVTIPVIVRLGNLDMKAGISNVRIERRDGKPAVAVDLSRSGRRSTFGEVRVLKPGVKDPIAVQRAVAVYTELNQRSVVVPVSDEFKGVLAGPVRVQYVETYDDGTNTVAETQAVLR